MDCINEYNSDDDHSPIDQTLGHIQDPAHGGQSSVQSSVQSVQSSVQSVQSVEDDTEIQEITNLQEIQQKTAWNQYIPIKSSLEKTKVEGKVDEFQCRAIKKLAILRSKGLHFNDQLLATKAFKNPCILDKMLDYHNINTHGSFIVTDHAFSDIFYKLQSAARDKSVDVKSDQKKSDSKNARSIQFVKSSHKSSYYDKRRRI